MGNDIHRLGDEVVHVNFTCIFRCSQFRGLVKSEAPRPQGGASRKGNRIFHCAPRPIGPLDPAYKAGLVGHLLAINQAAEEKAPDARFTNLEECDVLTSMAQ